MEPGIPQWDILSLRGRSHPGAGTRGKEASEYPQEKKANAMPLVGATESGTAQTEHLPVREGECGVVGPCLIPEG